MFLPYRFQTDEEARNSGIGANGGDLIIIDTHFKPVLGERVYAPHERALAEKRCEELKDANIPNIFDDIE